MFMRMNYDRWSSGNFIVVMVEKEFLKYTGISNYSSIFTFLPGLFLDIC